MIKAFKYGVRCDSSEDAVTLINIFRKEGKVSLSGVGRIWGLQGKDLHKANTMRILNGFTNLSVERFIKVLRFFGYALYIRPLSYNPYTGEPEDFDIDRYNDLEEASWDIEEDISGIYKEEMKKNNPD